ncbi:hypothetical protein RR46_12855 [Papilio xuthus]|uniref:Uncharacterized protein n=1 Tax=Papilio xuthus TaxID=66420 RepID=A0A194PRD4_PAPXU|nr:hypothetical protein RR46_12855 [Papilio xuthus]
MIVSTQFTVKYIFRWNVGLSGGVAIPTQKLITMPEIILKNDLEQNKMEKQTMHMLSVQERGGETRKTNQYIAAVAESSQSHASVIQLE